MRERAKYGRALLSLSSSLRELETGECSVHRTSRSARLAAASIDEIIANTSQFAVSSCCRLVFARVHHSIRVFSAFLQESIRVSDVSIGCRRMRLAYIRVTSFCMIALIAIAMRSRFRRNVQRNGECLHMTYTHHVPSRFLANVPGC